MSCFLPHKEAVNNLKADLEKSGYKTIPLGTRINIQAFQEHNRLVVEEAKKIQEVVNQWNAGLSKIGITGSVVKTITKPFEGDKDSFVGINRNLINIEFNNDVLNQLDNARKNLGIYDSKLSYSSYLKEQQELIKDLDVIKPGVEELFNSNPELANAVYEAAGFIEPFRQEFTKIVAERINKTPIGKSFSIQEAAPRTYMPYVIKQGENKFYIVGNSEIYTLEELYDYLLDNFQEPITPQQKQQAQQLYSQYLDTIFPDSKVKDIKGFKNFVAKPGVAPFSEKTEGGVKLKDGNSYTSKQLSAKMLLAMGYTIDEAGKIIKDNKC